jgi:hypothetical protein
VKKFPEYIITTGKFYSDWLHTRDLCLALHIHPLTINSLDTIASGKDARASQEAFGGLFRAYGKDEMPYGEKKCARIGSDLRHTLLK